KNIPIKSQNKPCLLRPTPRSQLLFSGRQGGGGSCVHHIFLLFLYNIPWYERFLYSCSFLFWFKENFCHHTPSATASVLFDDAEVTVDDGIVRLEAFLLCRAKTLPSLRRHNQVHLSIFDRNLQHIPRKMLHLLIIYGYDFFAGLCDMLRYSIAISGNDAV